MRNPRGLMPLSGQTEGGPCDSLRCLSILVTWFTLVAAPCLANPFTAFGPQTFRRAEGTPVTVKATFQVLNPSAQYFVRLRTDGVASAVISLNGVTIIDPSRFNENVTSIEAPVTLKAGNEIAVEVHGGPGGTIVLEVIGIDNEPPTIVATATPPPNGRGWNNSNVTVTFTCADTTSGIATCPPPVGVSTEGQGRSVMGTAVDKAGNTATASVLVNLDKTAPVLTSNQSPNANPDGWNNTPVMVTFSAADALSGVATGSVTAPITVTSDGVNLSASGQATDLAGNIGSVTRSGIKIDQTKPTVSATTSPAPNASGWNNTAVTVHFVCSDPESGVAACPADQVVASDGANQAVTGMALDRAGNTATSGATVNVDRAPPVLTFTSPANGATVPTSTALIAGTVSDASSGVAGVMCNGVPAIVTGTAFNCTVTLTPGTNPISATVADKAGNTTTTPLSLIFGSTVTAPRVTITSPTDLSYTTISPTTITGTVDDVSATVAVNSIPVAVANGAFTLALPVAEGPNTITAVATSGNGTTGTASVNITLDTTPPHVTVTSPPDGFVTTDSSISVAGIVNDLVVGTVNDQQARVTVNGGAAQVANRTFLTANVPLVMGSNLIQAVAIDRVGNAATTEISVTRQAPAAEARIRLVSGNNQAATIGSALSAPLVVAVTDSAGNPVTNKPVVFKVTLNDGSLIAGGTSGPTALATTDGQGQAQVRWTLGTRAGAGSNAAEAYVVGFAGTALFTATGTSGPAGKIVIDTGNYQIGAIGEPLPKPLIAVVVDDGNNRLAGVPVTFTVKRGGGTINGQTAVTVDSDSDGRVATTLTLGLQEGNANNLVEVNFPSNQGFPAAFTASGRAPGDASQTTISGVVLDNSNQPIPGVTMRAVLTNYLHANGNAVQLVQAVQTNAQGQFTLPQAPVGAVKLLADGSTAQLPGHYPSLEYDLETVAGQNNTVEQPIYLLPLDTANQLCVTASSGGGTLTIPDAPGFSLTFGPGQVTFPGGSKTGCVSVTVVHGDKVPMLPGFGQQPRFIVTIQPAGAVFNPPAPITLPNVDGLRPREVTEMYSFDHDIGSFVAIGTGVVSADGQVIRSSAGVGVLKAGWHCGGNPAGIGTAATCPTCQKCDGVQCVPDDSNRPTEKCASCDNGRLVPAKTEQQCCDEAISAHPGKDTDGGFVICCNGQFTACVNPAGYPGGTLGGDIVRECAVEHEQSHFNDLAVCPSGANECDVSPPLGVPPSRLNSTECSAYQVGIQCLTARLYRCGSDEDCLNEVNKKTDFWREVREGIPGCIVR